MITINLLPDEFRRKAKTPVKMMSAVAVAVTVNATLIAYFGYLKFGVAANIETTRSVLQLDMDGLKPQVEYHDALDKEIQVRSAREQTLSEINKGRVLWTKKIDELIDVVHAGREGIEHYIWFDDINVKMESGGTGRRKTSFGTFKASGHSGSIDYDQVANFLEDVEDADLSGFISSFSKPAAPEAKMNEPDEDLIPSVNWSFPLTLELLSPEERAANSAVVEEEAR